MEVICSICNSAFTWDPDNARNLKKYNITCPSCKQNSIIGSGRIVITCDYCNARLQYDSGELQYQIFGRRSWKEVFDYLRDTPVDEIAQKGRWYILTIQNLAPVIRYGHDMVVDILVGLYDIHHREAFNDPYIIELLKYISYGWDEQWKEKLVEFVGTYSEKYDFVWTWNILKVLQDSGKVDEIYRCMSSLVENNFKESHLFKSWTHERKIIRQSMFDIKLLSNRLVIDHDASN